MRSLRSLRMRKIQVPNIDLAALVERLRAEFQDLDPNDPSRWPVLPRALLLAVVTCATAAALWFGWISDYAVELDQETAKEAQLKGDFKTKLTKAANLVMLKKQRDDVEQYVKQIENLLPNRAEMAALLYSINQAGVSRNLQFELFRPGQEVVKPYYAELPISIRVVGRFHDFGLFASDMAFLPRIATLNNLTLSNRNDATMVLEATVKAYRYLDADELAAQRKPSGEVKK